jgi:hypothetical protein
MKALLPALLLCCPVPALAARTPFQVRCEDSISKTVSVLTAHQNGYSVNSTLSFRTLTSMKGATYGGRGYVLGLTKTESRVSIALDGPILQDAATGYECVAPKIDVSLFYVPIVIYVGREFAPGSCAYGEILAHEMRHLKTYLDHLPKVEAVVRAALDRRFEGKPLYAPVGQAKALLEHEIDTGWMPYIQAEMSKVELLQAAIDSPEEYSRLSKVCKGEVQSIIRVRHRPVDRSGKPAMN